MASLGSKLPTSLYTTTCAFDVYTLLPCRSAITANASGTFGSGTCVHRVGTGSVMSSALNPCGFCASNLTPFDCRYSRIVPETAGVTDGGIGAAAAGPGAPGAVAVFGGTNGVADGAVAITLFPLSAPGLVVTFCGAGAATPGATGAGGGAGARGSAEALAPAKTATPIRPATRPPKNR